MAAKRIKRPKQSTTRTQPRKQSSARMSTLAAKAPRKQTGDNVSVIASRVLRVFQGVSDEQLDSVLSMGGDRFTFRELRALAASCLSQDELKGQSPAKARKRAKRK
jgi:hypothetical protein